MVSPTFSPNSNVTSLKALDFLAWACRSQKVLSGTLDTDEDVLALPPIQRSAVWRPRQVLAFWDSLLSNLPVGMFYLIEENGLREIVVGQETRTTDRRGYDLLDGQQRLRALALGADDPFGERRCLWVKFLEGGYELRLTSKTQPFGYDKDGNKLSIPDRQKARAAIEPEPRTLQFLNRTQTRTVYDADLYEKAVINGSTRLATPPYPYGCSPTNTAKFSELLCKWEREKSEDTLQALIPTATAAAIAKLHVGFSKLAEAEIALMRLDGSHFAGKQGKEDLMKLFARIGAGGTALSAEEQLYSAYKLHYPMVRNVVEKIHETVSAVLAPAKIVGTALRIARVQGVNNPAVMPDLQTFTNAIDASNGELKSMMDRLKSLLPPTSDVGELHPALLKVKQLLGYADGQDKFWLPDVMLAALSPELWQVVALWAVQAPSDVTVASREEVVRFALFWHLCIFNQERAVRDSFRLLAQLNDSKQLTGFPGRKLYSRLTGAEGQASAYQIFDPHIVEPMFIRGEGCPNWLDENNRFGEGASRNQFAITWWYAAHMLPWLQRNYVAATFPGYKPLSDHEDDLPYDKDHISARKHWFRDGRSYADPFDATVTADAKKSMWSARDVVGNSIGNLRLVDSSVNRSAGAEFITAKMPFLHEPYDPEKGLPEDFAFDFPDIQNLWKRADEPRQIWSADRLLAFQAAVGQRTAQLYRRFFDHLGYSNWM
jgi:hypothetical protein